MISIRRIYVYLLCAITLQALVWAIIALLRNLTAGNLNNPTSEIALQISMILVGLPLYLVHWLWAQRSAARDEAERASAVRRLYINSMIFAFIIPFVNSAYLLIETLFLFLIRSIKPVSEQLEYPFFSIIAMVVVAVMALYHYLIRQGDDAAVGREESTVLLDQLFLYLLSMVGLVLTASGVVELIRILLESLSSGFSQFGERRAIASNVAQVLSGLPLWIITWRQAQIRFRGDDVRERYSAIRKIYLYLLIFISSLTVVTTATILLANLFLRLLDVPSASGGFFQALSIILVSGAIWAYHAAVLRQDADVAEGAAQAAVRRLYLYLISGVGLTAVLIGLGGILSVLIRALDSATLRPELREQLAWFTATLIAGLPIWLLNWRRIQIIVTEEGQNERASIVRRFYLYFFIFIAVITLLGGAVYVVSQLVELALGSRTSSGLLTDMGQALAYTLIAIAVLIYHGSLLRSDQNFIIQQRAEKLKQLSVAIIDPADGRFGQTLQEHLAQQLPGLNVHLLSQTAMAEPTADAEDSEEKTPLEIVVSVDVIVAPWPLMDSTAYGGEISHAFKQSPAQKLLLPLPEKQVTWIGAQPWQEKSIIKQVVDAVESIAKGEKVSRPRRQNPITIAIILLISLWAFIILITLVIQLIALLLERPF